MIDILNADGTPTGRVEPKEVVYRDGLWHRAATLVIINNDNEFLMQKRALTKRHSPGKWGNGAAGHIDAGEDSASAIIREAREELGIEITESDLIKIGEFRTERTTGCGDDAKLIMDLYMIRGDYKISDMKKQKSEVADIRYIPIPDMPEFMANNPTMSTLRDDIWGMVERYLKAEN